MYSVTHSKSPFIHLTVTSNSTFPWVSLPSPETWFLLELHSSVNMASPFSFQNSNLERYWKTDTFQIQRTPAVVNVTWIHGPLSIPIAITQIKTTFFPRLPQQALELPFFPWSFSTLTLLPQVHSTPYSQSALSELLVITLYYIKVSLASYCPWIKHPNMVMRLFCLCISSTIFSHSALHPVFQPGYPLE